MSRTRRAIRKDGGPISVIYADRTPHPTFFLRRLWRNEIGTSRCARRMRGDDLTEARVAADRIPARLRRTVIFVAVVGSMIEAYTRSQRMQADG
jgi:hypothetical protein